VNRPDLCEQATQPAILHISTSEVHRPYKDSKTSGQSAPFLLEMLFALCKPSSVEPPMYAVFEDGSRQYRVSEGDVVKLDYRDVPIGTRFELNRVLLYQGGEGLQIGQPTLAGARILVEVV